MSEAKILLIGTEDCFAEVAAQLSENFSVQMFRADSLGAACMKARREAPVLILVDADMMGLDAVGCCAALKGDVALSAIPIFALVPEGMEEGMDMLRQAGCDDFLAKPIATNLFAEKACQYIPHLDRREVRVPCYAHVTIKDEDDIYYGMTGDISARGLFVATFDRLPAEGELRLSFALPKDQSVPIEPNGRVVWLNSKQSPMCESLPEGFGVEFTRISQEELDVIRKYIMETKNNALFRQRVA